MTSEHPDHCPICRYSFFDRVVQEWGFYIPHKVPSQNEMHNDSAGNKYKYKQYRSVFEDYCRIARLGLHIPEATRARRVLLYRYTGHRGRIYDYANFVGGCKPVIDAMVNMHLLVDDKEDMMRASYAQEKGTHVTQAHLEERFGALYWITHWAPDVGGLIVRLQDVEFGDERTKP